MPTIEESVTKTEKIDKTDNELGRSRIDIRTAQSGKHGATDDTKWQISVSPTSRWANRFIIAAIVQGALAAGVTAYLLYDAVYGSPGSAKIVAGGSAGTWLTVGYLGYIMLGPLAAAVTALFYQHLEVNLRSPYKGWTNILAWLQLVLMNVGVVGATWLMMNGGYRGGALTITLEQQNPTWSIGQVLGQVHVQVLSGYPSYIAPFAALAIIGAFAGGLGFVAVWRRALKKTPPTPE
jgi:hypothetical protein